MKLWSSECQEKEKDGNSVPRILGFFDLFAVGLGSSLAFGLFVLIGGVIKNVTGPAVVVSVSLAGATALVGGLCFSEFAVRCVKVNSAYAYSYFWGRQNAAFIFGWILLLEYVAGVASAARGIVTFVDALADYKISEFLNNVASVNFQNFFPYFDFFSLGVVVLLTICIVFGLKDFLIIKKLFTIFNAVLVVSVITAGAFKADPSNWRTEHTAERDFADGFAPFGVVGILKGAAVAFYGFIGFDRISVSGNEVQKPKRNIPAAILLTVFATLFAYGGVAIVLSLMLPYEKIHPDAAVPFAFQEMEWPTAKWIVAVAAFLCFQTSLFGAIFPLPSIIHAMANDGLLFPCLGNSHQKIPVVATLTGGLLAAVAAGIFTFQKLVNLTVIATLFAYTILAINVILLRYCSKSDDDGMLSDSWKNLINKNADVSVKTVVRNYFNFREKHPTNLTEKIITGNVILFCISSVGLGVILNFFFNSLSAYAPETVVPAGILLSIMCFNLISMICQPKSQEGIPFRVPLIPLFPCLGIFLNIILILTFESLTWILFSSWIAVGVLPQFAWHLVKYFRGETGKNSLYEINRTNAVKLNESIWKIKSDKKNFYEGAINPVFSDELEDRFHEINGDLVGEIQNRNENTVPQLKQAEIIQAAEVVVEEKVDSLASELDVDFVGVEEVVNGLPEEDGRVHWECVAEIHTEDFQQESVALEIVDNTYNFLTEVAEELSKDDGSLLRDFAGSEKESSNGSENFFKSTDGSNTPPSQISNVNNEDAQEKLPNNELKLNDTDNPNSELFNEYSGDIENTKPTILNEDRKPNENTLFFDFSKKPNQTLSYFPFGEQSQKKLELENRTNNNETDTDGTISNNKNKITPAGKSDEHSKVKEFKEKLNQLLKDHVKSSTSPKTSLLSMKSTETDDVDTMDKSANNNGNNKEDLFSNIKTLSKSQIKGQLEFLLSKGPPKRSSLRDSFNIKLRETDKENDSGKANDETVIFQNGKDSESEKHLTESSSSLQDSIKQKLLALKNLRGESPKDVCC